MDMIALPTDEDVRSIVDLTSDRKNFIGGSDAPIILGVSSWKTGFELYQEKTGAVEPEDLSDVERVQWGIVLEDVVAQMYSRRTGKKTRRVNDRRLADDHGFPMAAQIDRMIVGDVIPLEIKTTDAMMAADWGAEGTDEIPLNYFVQVQHQLAVLRKPYAEVAVLIGGNRLRLYRVDALPEFIDRMIQAEREFWHQCQTLTPPDPVTVDEATLRWGRAPAVQVQGDEADGALAALYKDLADQIKALEAQQDEIKLVLQKKIQDLGDTLVVGGVPVATWKPQTSNRLDQKAIQAELPEIAAKYTKPVESRVFRIAKGADIYRRRAS